MRRIPFNILFYALLILSTVALSSPTAMATSDTQEKQLHIATLHWPPFTADNMPENGAAIHLLKQLLEHIDLTLNVTFAEWEDAIDLAKNDPNVNGYYPAWTEDVRDGFIGTQPLFRSPVGFAQRADAPIQWKTIDDLKKYKYAIVAGYTYPDEFGEIVKNSEVEAITVTSDLEGLILLRDGKIDAFPIDLINLSSLLKTEPELKNSSIKITPNTHIIRLYDLILVLNDNEENRNYINQINKKMETLNGQHIIYGYISKYLR